MNFIVSGQGVFLFSIKKGVEQCSFQILNQGGNDGLDIYMKTDGILINRVGMLDPLVDKNNNKGISDQSGAYYWCSIDSQNGQIYLGIGEARIETAVYRYKYQFGTDEERKNNKAFLESLDYITFPTEITPIRVLRDPITSSIPLAIKPCHAISMNSLAEGLFMNKPHLSVKGQVLYECIGGEQFVLNDDDFPDFSKAIEKSIADPNGWCYKRLQEKSTEFSKDKPDILETYLRITLGQNNGESPGIPYVMEIWPPQHYSPIHNHAGAEAIIRVLHGIIQVALFPFLGSDQPFQTTTFEKDDCTWISPTLNQTHQLHNVNRDTTCVTIQCYMYGTKDITHYDYFDYIDPNGAVQQYEPDSDMDFRDFKKLMKEEWTNQSKNVDSNQSSQKNVDSNQSSQKIVEAKQTDSSRIMSCFGVSCIKE